MFISMAGLENKPLTDYFGSSNDESTSEIMAMMRMMQQEDERKRKAVIDEMKRQDAMRRYESDEKHKRAEASRRDRLESYKYMQDQKLEERRLKEQIERESRNLIVDRIHPLVKEQKERWKNILPFFKNVKVVLGTLSNAGNNKSSLKPYFDSASIQAMDRIFEQMTGASRVSVMHESELNSRLTTIEPKLARMIRSWKGIISTNTNIMNPEQRAEFKNFLENEAISVLKDYDKSMEIFKEEHQAIEGLINPEYRKKYPLQIPRIHEHDSGLYQDFKNLEKGYDEIEKMQREIMKQPNALAQILDQSYANR